jgi:hypothetical protein
MAWCLPDTKISNLIRTDLYHLSFPVLIVSSIRRHGRLPGVFTGRHSLSKVFSMHIYEFSNPPQPSLRTRREMTSWTILQAAANFATIADALASWHVGSALAIPAYDALRLRTQVDRLLDEQYILRRVIFPENYPHLSDARRERVTNGMNRYVLTPIVCSMVSHSRSI